jgi:ParB-like chromosome segregation protein Spo0J
VALMPIREIRVDGQLSSLLPEPGAEQFRALVEDIRVRGVLVELLVTEDGLLLDGHRRLQAAKEAGLETVPVKTLAVSGEETWEKSVALAANLLRRQLTEVQRACLGSSLLRIERKQALVRQREGQKKGREHRWQSGLVVDDDHPEPPEACRATQKVADAVGVSRQTLERVEAVKARDPSIVQAMLKGEISVTSAYKRVKVADLEKRARQEGKQRQAAPGRVDEFESVFGKYRTVYLDPPWAQLESQARDAQGGTTPGAGVERLAIVPVRNLCHKNGCHCWLWTPWSLIRKGMIQRLFEAWELRWVAELIWDQGSVGKGHWFHARTQVLILTVSGNLPLLRTDVAPVVSARANASRTKPEEFYGLIETVSVGPRIELFARYARSGWDRWNAESHLKD